MRRISFKIKKRVMTILLTIILLIAVKVIWMSCTTSGHGSFDGEKKDIIRRANFLTAKVATSPQQLLINYVILVSISFVV